MNINELSAFFRIPLLGRIDSHIVAIAVKNDRDRLITVRFYLDKEPKASDIDKAQETASEIYTQLVDSGIDVDDVIGETLFSDGKEYGELDPMDGWVFAREARIVEAKE